MELYELGVEYLNRCEILLDRIHELNQSAQNTKGDEKTNLKRRIAMLYDDAAQCRECALILINYRRKEKTYDEKSI